MTGSTHEAALAALAWAIINEQDGRRYYSKIADHVRDDKGRQMFHGLAEDEIHHYHILVAEYLSLRDSGQWMPIAQAKKASVPAIEDFTVSESDFPGETLSQERLFPNPDDVIPSLKAGTGDGEAIDLALKAEQRGYEIYKQAYEEAGDPGAKAAYKLLMDEENRHYEWLQKSQRYLLDNDTYWDDSELPFFTA